MLTESLEIVKSKFIKLFMRYVCTDCGDYSTWRRKECVKIIKEQRIVIARRCKGSRVLGMMLFP